MPINEFVLIHGYGDHKPDRWQVHLEDALRVPGHAVHFPNLPKRGMGGKPKLKAWRQHIEHILWGICLRGHRATVITHSLGSSLWLHLLADENWRRNIDRILRFAILVAPAKNDCGIDRIEDFFPLPHLDPTMLENLKSRHLIVHSENDHVIDQGQFKSVGRRTGFERFMVEGGDHFMPPSLEGEHGQWPGMIAAYHIIHNQATLPTATLRSKIKRMLGSDEYPNVS
jgi:predicted alpha/beta hydrolase family esterase